jgi:hypothetical protein
MFPYTFSATKKEILEHIRVRIRYQKQNIKNNGQKGIQKHSEISYLETHPGENGKTVNHEKKIFKKGGIKNVISSDTMASENTQLDFQKG